MFPFCDIKSWGPFFFFFKCQRCGASSLEAKESVPCFQRHNSLWCRETKYQRAILQKRQIVGGETGTGLTRASPWLITADNNDWSLWGHASRNKPSSKFHQTPPWVRENIQRGWVRTHKNSAGSRDRGWGWMLHFGWLEWEVRSIVPLSDFKDCMYACVCFCVCIGGGGRHRSISRDQHGILHSQAEKRLHHKVTLTTPAEQRASLSLSLSLSLSHFKWVQFRGGKT